MHIPNISDIALNEIQEKTGGKLKFLISVDEDLKISLLLPENSPVVETPINVNYPAEYKVTDVENITLMQSNSSKYSWVRIGTQWYCG